MSKCSDLSCTFGFMIIKIRCTKRYWLFSVDALCSFVPAHVLNNIRHPLRLIAKQRFSTMFCSMHGHRKLTAQKTCYNVIPKHLSSRWLSSSPVTNLELAALRNIESGKRLPPSLPQHVDPTCSESPRSTWKLRRFSLFLRGEMP